MLFLQNLQMFSNFTDSNLNSAEVIEQNLSLNPVNSLDIAVAENVYRNLLR